MSLTNKNVRVRGKWWHYQFNVNGRTLSGNTGLEGCEQNRIATQSYAEDRRRESLFEIPNAARGSASGSDGERISFDSAAGKFIAWARDVEYRSKPNSALRLKTTLASCSMFFGDRAVLELGPGAIEAYKQFRVLEHGVRDITLRHDLHALSVFFRYAAKMGWCETNPVRQVKIPGDRDAIREHVVSLDEEARYLISAKELHARYVQSRRRQTRALMFPNMHDLAVLMVEQGARPEEILTVRKEHIDIAAGTMQIAGGKTRAARRILTLTARSLSVIEPRLTRAPGSFRPTQGANFTQRNFKEHMTGFAGKPVSHS